MQGQRPLSYKRSTTETEQCALCLHLFDEGMLTVCMLHDWCNVAYDGVCDDFKGLDYAT